HVEEAARRQAADGGCFNGPGRAWVELAEHLVGLTPWAAWTVFAKNGSDVCTWTTEVARAATGRRKVLAAKGAYHGAHAWCTPVPDGTTPEDRAHVVNYRYNDLGSVDAALAASSGDVAAIVVSPFRHDVFHDQAMPAAVACLKELESSGAIAHMAQVGSALRAGIERQAAAHHLDIRCSGPPAIPFMTFVADEGSFERSRVFAAACAAHGVYLHPH